jgi:hypothetical protein
MNHYQFATLILILLSLNSFLFLILVQLQRIQRTLNRQMMQSIMGSDPFHCGLPGIHLQGF